MRLLLAISIVAALISPLPASADVMTLEPTPRDLYDLDHNKYYTWGIQPGLGDPSLVVITCATLKFAGIFNWDWHNNDLYVHLLDTAPAGVTVGTDYEGGGDYFESAAYASLGIDHILLTHIEDLPWYPPQNINVPFDAAALLALNQYYQNGGDFGLGFDPDCHFYNCGVSLEMCYEVIPEPATLSVLALGGMCLVRRRRRRR